MNEGHPIFRAAPHADDGVHLTPWGDVTNTMRYFVYRDVLDELAFAAEYHQGKVCAALLTGPFGVEPQGPFLEVTGFEGFVAWEMLDARTLFEHLRAVMLEQFAGNPAMITASGQGAVGFFVHVPGGGVLLQEAHVRAHLSLFNVPYQAVLLLDTALDRVALYGRAPGPGFFNSGFVLVEPERLTRGPGGDEDAPHPKGSDQEE